MPTPRHLSVPSSSHGDGDNHEDANLDNIKYNQFDSLDHPISGEVFDMSATSTSSGHLNWFLALLTDTASTETSKLENSVDFEINSECSTDGYKTKDIDTKQANIVPKDFVLYDEVGDGILWILNTENSLDGDTVGGKEFLCLSSVQNNEKEETSDGGLVEIKGAERNDRSSSDMYNRMDRRECAAIRPEQKNYSDVQLIDSTLNISDLLLGAGAINAKEECAKSIGFVNGPRYLNGVRVGIGAKPSAEFVAAVFGTWLSGGVAVPLALSYPESELLHVMNDSDISMILSTQDHQGIMENMAVKCSARLSLLPTLARSAVEFMPKFSVRGQSVSQRWCDSYPKDRNTVEDAITVFTGVPIMYTRLM
ncbi:hypothetical protein ZIOFF_068415 [Zingiber officinale]|uniref:AMP-dependent synthetase/ligase domain-containing protein n=1 Tax=Zingiber officinale TaxID=94328 RepID=A0A8J5BLQ3_ZINOF|nr:hypothetical protein ZIOFF_068415 [Zingiber officinale]